ncbi:hypothetical protein [Algihabitans sp.]|uniref:hypothetical protein n=1 Tax=Algihabitans sp. TaxID=2821514 RepID=UPI003BACD02A
MSDLGFATAPAVEEEMAGIATPSGSAGDGALPDDPRAVAAASATVDAGPGDSRSDGPAADPGVAPDRPAVPQSDPEWEAALARARWIARLGRRRRRPDGTREDWLEPAQRAELERRGRVRLAFYKAADAFAAREGRAPDKPEQRRLLAQVLTEEDAPRGWAAAMGTVARNDAENARGGQRPVAERSHASSTSRLSLNSLQSPEVTNSLAVENAPDPTAISQDKAEIGSHSAMGSEAIRASSTEHSTGLVEQLGESWTPSELTDQPGGSEAEVAFDGRAFEPREYDWEPAGSLDVGGRIELEVDGPLRADLRTSAFGIDGRRYRVQWYPKAADGSVLPLMTTPDGFAGTEHGGHVTLLGPASEYILPPFPSEYGYLVRITMPRDGGKTHGTAAAYLQVFQGRKRSQGAGRPLLSAETGEDKVASDGHRGVGPDPWAEDANPETDIQTELPIINDPDERTASILNDTPARFAFTPDPEADSSSPIWEMPVLGRIAIERHGQTIDEMSKKHGVDPDLVRAILWLESARGHYVIVGNYIADRLDLSNSAMPMNINSSLWGGLIGETDTRLEDPVENIEAAIILIRRISDRLEAPTPEAIGSIWNYIGRETTHDRGAYVGRIYREKPWLQP